MGIGHNDPVFLVSEKKIVNYFEEIFKLYCRKGTQLDHPQD